MAAPNMLAGGGAAATAALWGEEAQGGDPYYVARDELHAAVEDLLREAATCLQQRGDASAVMTLRDTAEELLEELQTIERSVDAAEKQAAKFNISARELRERRLFVEQERSALVTLLQQLTNDRSTTMQQESRGRLSAITATPGSSSSGAAAASGGSSGNGSGGSSSSASRGQRNVFPAAASTGSTAVDVSLGSTTTTTTATTGWRTPPQRHFFSTDDYQADYGDTSQHRHHQQEMLLRQQDYQLEELSQSAERLHETACTINRELEDQQRILDELDEDLDQQAAQMNFLLRRMGRLLKTNNVRQLCLILWLSCLALLLFLLLIIT